MFSESHSRYLLVVEKSDLKKVESQLKKSKIDYGIIGTFDGDQIVFEKSKKVADLRVDKARKTWMRSLGEKI